MGVTHLWELLSPVGRTVDLSTLANQRLAVDASIWITQFIKAMRDEDGNQLPAAHLLGFFRRIVRLLCLNIKPVFVFDGGTPALKRQTVSARRERREAQGVRLRRVAEKMLLNRLSQKIVADQLAKEQAAATASAAPGEEEDTQAAGMGRDNGAPNSDGAQLAPSSSPLPPPTLPPQQQPPQPPPPQQQPPQQQQVDVDNEDQSEESEKSELENSEHSEDEAYSDGNCDGEDDEDEDIAEEGAPWQRREADGSLQRRGGNEQRRRWRRSQRGRRGLHQSQGGASAAAGEDNGAMTGERRVRRRLADIRQAQVDHERASHAVFLKAAASAGGARRHGADRVRSSDRDRGVAAQAEMATVSGLQLTAYLEKARLKQQEVAALRQLNAEGGGSAGSGPAALPTPAAVTVAVGGPAAEVRLDQPNRAGRLATAAAAGVGSGASAAVLSAGDRAVAAGRRLAGDAGREYVLLRRPAGNTHAAAMASPRPVLLAVGETVILLHPLYFY